tara:strand:+ start:197432 stop:198601 length:1170 start_codon:yes stop_codon:yes gene_type:complete
MAKAATSDSAPHSGDAERCPERCSERAIDGDAALMQNSAANAGQYILNMRKDMDNSGRRGEPLIILVGEDHESTQHYLHHMLLLEALKPLAGNLMIAYEQPHDLLARFYAVNNALTMTSTIANSLEELDSKTALSLKLRFYGADNPYAYFAHKTLAHYILERFNEGDDLSFVGTDIAYDSDEIIDYNNQDAVDSIAACGANSQDLISIHDPVGMKIRNHHMARTLRNQALAQNASIVVQFCGKAHLNGNASHHDPKYSLSQYIKKSGGQICVLPLNTEGFVMPHNDLQSHEVVPCHTPNGPVAEYDPRFKLTSKVDERPVQDNKLLSKKQEAFYIAEKLEMFNLSEYALDLGQYEALKRKYRRDVEQCFAHMLSSSPPKTQCVQGFKLG